MALTIGELNAYVDLDDSGFQSGVDRTESKFQGLGKRLGGTGKAIGGVAGAAIGAGLVAGATRGLEMGEMEAELEARLGAQGPVAGRAGEVAGRLYSQGYGASLSEVGDATQQVVSNIKGMSTASEGELAAVTGQVMSLARTLRMDVGGATQAVSSMISSGIAGTAAEAMDILTAGAGTSANKVDDLGETFGEYSTNFRTLGLSGAEALGLMSQATDNGARSSDQAADALKEFSVRAGEGSKGAVKAFQAIGLNGETMAQRIADGGPRAREALAMTLAELQKMPPSAEKNRVAMELFGSAGEDMAGALGSMDLSTATQGIGEVAGAAQNADAAFQNTAQNTIEQVTRKFSELGMAAVNLPGPLGTAAAAAGVVGPGFLSMVGPIMAAVAAQRAAGAAAVASGAAQRGSILATAAVTVANWVRMGAVALAQGARMAAGWILAMGPVGWVIAAVLGLVALIIANWDSIVSWTTNAWNNVTSFIQQAALNIVASVTSGVMGAYNAVVSWLNNAVSFVAGLPGMILGALGNLGSLLVGAGQSLIYGFWDGIKAAFSWVKGQFSNLLGTLRNLLPFSPAKEGPFSGQGYTTHSGRAMMRDLGKGIGDGEGEVHDALSGAMENANGALTKRSRIGSRRIKGGDGAEAAAMYDAVRDALDGSRMSIDGRGTARLVNRQNRSDRRRGGGLAPAARR